MTDENSQQPEIIQPHPALKRLDRLVGTWRMTGGSPDSDRHTIIGTAKFEWLPGGFFLQNTGEIEMGTFKLWSMEIIGYNEPNDNFISTVYSSMEGVMRTYHWDLRGDTLTHWEESAKYTGIISADGNTITGGWRPFEGVQSNEGNTYDAIMTRVV